MKALTYLSLAWWLLGFTAAGGYFLCPDVAGHWQREQLRSDSLDKAGQQVSYLFTRRMQVCQELEDGRLTLPEAAARFRAIDGTVSASLSRKYATYPGSSEGERLCRKVIDYVEILYPADKADAAPLRILRARLEAELQRLLDHSDTITLPHLTP
jgi:hypothetical protein